MLLRLAGFVARATGWLSRRLGRGGGTTIPGVVLLRLQPHAIREMSARLSDGVVLVSATNGKTTTTRLLVAAAEATGRTVVTNAEGSNLAQGVAAALLDAGDAQLGIFEVDEAALPAIAAATSPRGIVLMNLFRDQLDRYGELDTLVERWNTMLDALGDGVHLVVNADDPNVAAIAIDRPTVTWFGLNDASQALPGLAHAADATTCRRCGNPIEHRTVLLGHLGHWACSTGDLTRPVPTVAATHITLAATGQQVLLDVGGESVAVDSGLSGLHNSYNLTAAIAATRCLPPTGGALRAIAEAVGATSAAFGRGETVAIEGRDLNLLLAKNPTGVNQNIRTVLAGDTEGRHVLAILNDRTADGRDVSWIWDVDWEPLDGRLDSLTLAGDRAHDLALRFRYGGFDMSAVTVEPDVGRALDAAVARTPSGSTLHALPTYTAMLELRAELTSRGLVDAYWSES